MQLADLPVVRQQLANPRRRLRRQPLENVLEVGVRIVPVHLGRVHQAHDRRGTLPSAQASREEPVRAPDCNRPDLVLNPVVVARQVAVNRLEIGKQFGATDAVNSSGGDAAQQVLALTGGRGVDTAIEAVGIPATFQICQDIVAAGGTIANIGVHGVKADLHLETLWSKNVTITTRLVDTVTIPMLLKTVRSARIAAGRLITHRFKFDKILDAYETFGRAADTKALKVIIET